MGTDAFDVMWSPWLPESIQATTMLERFWWYLASKWMLIESKQSIRANVSTEHSGMLATLPVRFALMNQARYQGVCMQWMVGMTKDVRLPSVNFLLYFVVLLGRLLRVHLITLEGECRPSVRTSVHKNLSNFNEIWCIHRGRWVMHDGMPYDPIQGQGHGASEVPKIALFKVCLLRHLQRELANDQ